MRRNEVWWAELTAPAGPRPVVVLTRDAVLDTLESIVVALVTRSVRELPSEVRLGRREGLPRPCVANLDNILTVPKRRLTRQLGTLSQEKTAELNRAIRFALDIPEARAGDLRGRPL